jgi:CRP/FNR family transcriptional regulator
MSLSARAEHRTESRQLSRLLAQRLDMRLGLSHRLLQQASSGTLLIAAGDRVSRLPFIVQGRIDSVLHLLGGEGGRVLPVSWEAGEVVLLSYLFTQQPSTVDLVDGSEIAVRWAAVADIEASLLDDQELLVLLVRFLAQRLRKVQVRERAWVERGVHERVSATLERLARLAPRNDAGHPVIIATHEELAERSGVSRPKLSQALKRLEQAGRLRLERKAIRIIELERLFEIE